MRTALAKHAAFGVCDDEAVVDGDDEPLAVGKDVGDPVEEPPVGEPLAVRVGEPEGDALREPEAVALGVNETLLVREGVGVGEPEPDLEAAGVAVSTGVLLPDVERVVVAVTEGDAVELGDAEPLTLDEALLEREGLGEGEVEADLEAVGVIVPDFDAVEVAEFETDNVDCGDEEAEPEADLLGVAETLFVRDGLGEGELEADLEAVGVMVPDGEALRDGCALALGACVGTPSP